MPRSLKTQKQQRQFKKTQKVAYKLYLNRITKGERGRKENDWKLAEQIVGDYGLFCAFSNQYGSRNPWRRTIDWWESTSIEKGLEVFVNDLKSLALFDLISLLTSVTIIVSLVTFLFDGERRRHDG